MEPTGRREAPPDDRLRAMRGQHRPGLRTRHEILRKPTKSPCACFIRATSVAGLVADAGRSAAQHHEPAAADAADEIVLRVGAVGAVTAEAIVEALRDEEALARPRQAAERGAEE